MGARINRSLRRNSGWSEVFAIGGWSGWGPVDRWHTFCLQFEELWEGCGFGQNSDQQRGARALPGQALPKFWAGSS